MSQQVVQIETRQRGFFGKLMLLLFIGFNLLMLVWLIGGMGAAGQGYEQMSDAQKAGTAIGAGIGMMFIITVWALGDIILGFAVLLTRGKKVIITRESRP